VDFLDLVRLAQNYNAAGKFWPQGDFNYDGVVGFEDLVKLAQNYDAGAPATAAISMPFPAGFQEDVATAFATVPEPGAGGAIFLGLAAALPRRTRSRRISA
jgi:hypothetical protein